VVCSSPSLRPRSPQVDKPLKPVTHSQREARPRLTFPAAGHRGPATGIKLYCLATEARDVNNLTQSRYYAYSSEAAGSQTPDLVNR